MSDKKSSSFEAASFVGSGSGNMRQGPKVTRRGGGRRNMLCGKNERGTV